MRLNYGNPYPIVESTPELEQKKRDLKKKTIEYIKNTADRNIDNMQSACLEAATRLDYSSRYGTDDFYKEGSPKTKKKGSR